MKPNQRPSRRTVRDTVAALLRNGDVSLQCTALQLEVSARSLQRRLGEMGTSHSDLVTEVRIEMACHLLAESNERICDIAARLGYAHASAFSRTFMRLMKIQPRVYRRQRSIFTQNQTLNRKSSRKMASPPQPE